MQAELKCEMINLAEPYDQMRDDKALLEREKLIEEISEWIDTAVIAEAIVDHLEEQGIEVTLSSAKNCWLSELEMLLC